MSSLPVAKEWLRRGAKALVSFTWPVLLTIVLTVIFMTAIVHFFGDVEQFREWQKAHYNYMLAWRLSLYAAIGLGWYRLRRTLKQRASDKNLFPSGLRRCEVMAIFVILLFELRRAATVAGVSLP
ncbi:hypothetical protein V476_14875 [Pseudomonas syringae KCTC 12500]|uniref:hypothetical protein n=1 Tax=Pseudomonas syringae TaxID=317 RepID=UPI00046AA631|nr:hypothetical protein [Pseudomonas syringae]KMY02355.1 hypothetical protein V476_14875 [Pseudomonas syringae KCTC 12500]KPY72681.1 hypothetical protein ALO45_200096 [Pseudomonas syringae pv. syringae]POR84566.1 hypothetical protein BKM21_17610 [Pseudomonas syringae pv. syringae]